MRTKVAVPLTTLALSLLLPGMILAQQNTTGGGDKGKQGRQPQPSQRERERDLRQQRERERDLQQRIRRPVRLSGKVILADGSPLAGSVNVELICNGSARQQAFTFSDGNFSFEVGSRGSMAFADASVGGNPWNSNTVDPSNQTGMDSFDGSMNLAGCELRAVLPGFLSDRLQLGMRRPLDSPEVGNIILRRLDKVSGSTVSLTALAAPKKARKAYEKATKELRKKKVKHSKVSKELEKAVNLYPKYAPAWNLLGTTRLKLKDEAGAREAFKQALEADPEYVSPYIELYMLEAASNRWAEVTRLSDRVLELNPYISQAHYFNALANFNLGKLDLAAKSIYQYKKDETSKMFANSYYLAGAILAGKGNLTSAAGEFRQFLKIFPKDRRAAQIREHLASWETQGLIEKTPPEASSSDQSNLRQ